DLVEILEDVFPRLSELDVASGRDGWTGPSELAEAVLGDDPQASAEALMDSVAEGASAGEIGSAGTFAAAARIPRFSATQEFGDWDTALHTFTFANAVEQGLRRSPSPELVRGVFDAAMSVYLDRFLNVPAAKVPGRAPAGDGAILDDLERLLDRQQQVDEAA